MESGIQFDEDKYGMNTNRAGSSVGAGTPGENVKGMSGWLMRHGLAKTENGAAIILIVVVFINFILAIVIFKVLS